ncbi:GNAT family N-acetyltransferase [Pseudovibrio sp. Tun.PSC04-5.I4]|uniref:GNAT family N-acetyltransferase n=1 Tax=Pseudovibrio sp. Tun.PSC04-5.I4 TaxID=1798213 RepID=UPI000889FD33|nr:GNAT family N-acetyltransferase [Pseudovibrio sp. Tun.PSC04-5.I4]SDQ83891.1 Acetyltransferase (GNAT) domain-containing protein [Pseudovibrio sp. Tun.PSC04-5.I4]
MNEFVYCLVPAEKADFDLLADIRQKAMKENMEANGLFDHALYRRYFEESFNPASTWKIVEDSEVLGFYVLWDKEDYLYLERLYFLPKAQGRGIGAGALNTLKQQAKQQGKLIKLEVLPKSRANDFYLRHAFRLTETNSTENTYEWGCSRRPPCNYATREVRMIFVSEILPEPATQLSCRTSEA